MWSCRRNQVSEDLLFKRQLLGRRLNDEIRVANLFNEVGRDPNERQRRVVNALHLQVGPDLVYCAVPRLIDGVANDRLNVATRKDLRNSATHQARTNDDYLF